MGVINYIIAFCWGGHPWTFIGQTWFRENNWSKRSTQWANNKSHYSSSVQSYISQKLYNMIFFHPFSSSIIFFRNSRTWINWKDFKISSIFSHQQISLKFTRCLSFSESKNHHIIPFHLMPVQCSWLFCKYTFHVAIHSALLLRYVY